MTCISWSWLATNFLTYILFFLLRVWFFFFITLRFWPHAFLKTNVPGKLCWWFLSSMQNPDLVTTFLNLYKYTTSRNFTCLMQRQTKRNTGMHISIGKKLLCFMGLVPNEHHVMDYCKAQLWSQIFGLWDLQHWRYGIDPFWERW